LGNYKLIDAKILKNSSRASSYVTDHGESDEYSPLENSSDARVNNATNKSKIFGKLMKLIRGKDSSNHLSGRVTSVEKSKSREDSINNGLRSEYETLTDMSRNSIDLNNTLSLKEESRRNSDAGSLKNFSRRKSVTVDLKFITHSFSDSYSKEKSNLIKYAEALKEFPCLYTCTLNGVGTRGSVFCEFIKLLRCCSGVDAGFFGAGCLTHVCCPSVLSFWGLLLRYRQQLLFSCAADAAQQPAAEKEN
jgi:hypothetical protein